MTNKKIAIVDCNNFYASCERVFNPRLRNKPVVVLSNNDGCVIARSSEAKKLGIGMGDAYYQIKDRLELYDVAVYSSNFTLYADMSARVMTTLQEFSPDIEIYSIDEAFLELTNVKIENYTDYLKGIRQTVLRDVGIPVSIGLSSSKTLSKAMNKLSKKFPEKGGVLSVVGKTSEEIDELLVKLDVEDVWGVGRQYTKFLNINGIYNAKQLKHSNLNWIKKRMTVQGERTILELNGISCIPLDQNPEPKKNIISTRSFGSSVTKKEDLIQAITQYCTIACEKLRSDNSKCGLINVFIHTSLFKPDLPQYYNNISIKIEPHTSYLPTIVENAIKGLDIIYKPSYWYKRAGIMLDDIIPEDLDQLHLFRKPDIDKSKQIKQKNLMVAMDKINRSWGDFTIRISSQGVKKVNWMMKQERKSPKYTTSWFELLKVKC